MVIKQDYLEFRGKRFLRKRSLAYWNSVSSYARVAKRMEEQKPVIRDYPGIESYLVKKKSA